MTGDRHAVVQVLVPVTGHRSASRQRSAGNGRVAFGICFWGYLDRNLADPPVPVVLVRTAFATPSADLKSGASLAPLGVFSSVVLSLFPRNGTALRDLVAINRDRLETKSLMQRRLSFLLSTESTSSSRHRS